MDDTESIKRKIKKLFALSKSPNAHEAASALEMAQALMKKHGIGAESVGQIDTSKEKFKGNGGGRPSKYELILTGSIATAFGCRYAYGSFKIKDRRYYGHTFIGVEHRVKVAAFMAEVLLRKLKSARTKYVQSLTRVKSRKNKILRADEFCMGWVITVICKLKEFTNSPEEEGAIEKAVRDAGWGGSVKFLDRKPLNRDRKDYVNGKITGAGIELQHGVEGEEAGSRLLQGG